MGKKYTYEEVIREFKEKNLKLLEENYIDTNTPLKFVCNKHPDIIQDISFITLKNGTACRFCSSHDKYPSDFENEFYGVRDDIELLSQYTGYEKNIDCKCRACNHIWHPKAGKLLNGRGCPECAKKQEVKRRD